MRTWWRRPGTGAWTVALLGGMVLAFAWAATRSDDRPRERRGEPDPMASIRDARQEVRDASTEAATRLSRDRWARELGPRAVAASRAGSPVDMGWPAGRALSEAEQDSILAALEQPDLVRLTDEEIAIGMYVESHPETVGRGPRAAAILGFHDGTPYCLRVVSFGERSVHPGHFLRWARRRLMEPRTSVERREIEQGMWRSDLLAGCTFVHRHGMPGEEVRAWLGARSSWDGATFEWLPENSFAIRKASDLAADALDVGSVLTGDFPVYGINVLLRGCLAGRRAECMKEFFPEGARPGPSGPTTVVERIPHTFIAGLGFDLLNRLEMDFGPRAFARFWRSDAAFDVAFESAFGMHPGDWVYRDAVARGEAVRAGPAPSLEAAATAGFLMLVGFGVGALAAIRRRVG